MMKVFDKNSTDFTGNGLAVLNTATNVKITRELNGEFKLFFDFPIDDGKWVYLKQRNKVLCEGQQFRIYQKARQKAGSMSRTVECLHVISDAGNKGEKFIPYFEPKIGYTPRSIMLSAFSGTMFNVMTDEEVAALGMQWVTSPTDIMEQSKTNPLEIIKHIIENLQKGELFVDNYNIALVERMGKDTGLHCTLSNNLQSLGDNESGSNLVTRLYAYGKDGLPLPSSVAPNGYIDSADGITNYGICVGFMDFDTIEDPNELYQKALWEFSSDNPMRIDIPDMSFTAKLVELYKLFGNNHRFSLGDSLKIKSNVMGIDTAQRIVKYTYYPYSHQDSDITFGRPPKSYADVIGSSAATAEQYLKTVVQNGQVKTAWMENLIKNLQQEVYAGLKKELTLHKTGDLWEFGNDTAIAIVDGVLAIADHRNPDGSWAFRTFGTGGGFTADEIVAGVLKGIKIQQVSETGTKLMEVFKDIFGGVIKVYDINGFYNAKIGVEAGVSDNRGGTLILYIDSPFDSAPACIPFQRVEFGIVSGCGVGNLRDINGKARVSFDSDSGFPFVGIRDANESLITYLTQNAGYINSQQIATQAWVNSQAFANQSDIFGATQYAAGLMDLHMQMYHSN